MSPVDEPEAGGEGPVVGTAGDGLAPKSAGEGPWLTWPLVLLAAAAILLGFVVGRRLMTPAPAGSLSSGSGSGAAAEIPAPAPDTAGLSVALDGEEHLAEGRPAPVFELPTPDGQTVSLRDFVGRPVVINFFATWCAPCRVEMPHLQAAWERHRDAGLVVLGVDVQEAPELVPPFLEDLGLTFPVGVDQPGAVADLYRVGILPTTYLVDREGKIARRRVGVLVSEADLTSELAYILTADEIGTAP